MPKALYKLLTPMPKGREVLPIGDLVTLNVAEAAYLETVKAIEFVEFVQSEEGDDAPTSADVNYFLSKLPADQVELLRQALVGTTALTVPPPELEPGPVPAPVAAEPVTSVEPGPATSEAAPEPTPPVAPEPAPAPAPAKPVRAKAKPKSE
ncbi:hypothetical protein [Sphingomonas sp. CCH15-F11]|uniref:hypothetical protein n=1 Tax=Sphingomonas sp. CCH15-F11 TaxID=1768785 RepID=UPI000A402904|nr:hypothetical protein [Sphingomonas sp. CCH15-F11]